MCYLFSGLMSESGTLSLLIDLKITGHDSVVSFVLLILGNISHENEILYS